MKIKFYHYKRLRGWDFLPQCESWQMYGKPDYTYKHFYSMTFELRAFRHVVGVNVQITRRWKNA